MTKNLKSCTLLLFKMHHLYNNFFTRYGKYNFLLMVVDSSTQLISKLLFFQGKGGIEVTCESKQGIVPSQYTGHPSYQYPQGRDYALDRGYPGQASMAGPGYSMGPACSGRPQVASGYPAGAPLIGQHQSQAAATGFSSLPC